ncbi:MAG: CBS domain-containing protein [Methanosarcinaceae archaeon]|nr:CBS domain-containing protein [Methanosarcinaceae archaeon]
MKTSFQVARVMGIPIKLHITFLLVLPLFAFIFASNPAPYGFGDTTPIMEKYFLSLVTTILLFTCILLHELGHSYLAKKYGFKIESITLLLFGGVASMEEMPRDSSMEAKMAVAGPTVSFTIAAICLGIIALFPSFSTTAPMRIIWIIGYINIILAVFNLLPAFPMDGGRVLRAWYAKKMSYVEATQHAAYVGKLFAFIMGMFGLLYNVWLLMIAFFVYIGASEEERSTKISFALEKVPVRNIMTREIVSVPPSWTIEEITLFMFEKKHMGYPVIEGNDLKGIITFTDVHKVPPEERSKILVSDLMTPDVISINADADSSDALKLMTTNKIGRVLVIDKGSVVGILSRTDLMRTLMFLGEQ